MEREGGVVGRLLGHGVLDKRIPPLWENRPEDFHLAGEVLDLATGLIVHSHYVDDRARAAGYDGPIWRIPHPAWPVPHVAPADGRGRAAVRHLRQRELEQARAAAARGVRALPPRAAGRAAAARRRGLARLRPRPAAAAARPRRGLVREAFVDETRLWSLMAACDVHVNLRSPTMGETSGTAIRALSLGKPLIVSDVGWFAELPTTSR